MTYAAVVDIQNEFRKITFDGTSDITDTRVTGFLEETDAMIDTLLSVRYQLPITGTKSLLVLKRIEIAVVAERIASILDLKQNKVVSSTIKQEYNKKDKANIAIKMLNQLVDGIIILPDAVLLDSQYGFSSYTEDNNIEPFFEKGVDQW